MGKSKRGDSEISKEKRISKENQDLKREISRLRKILSRVDLDRYEQVREIIEEHYADDRKNEGQEILDKMKQEWKCHDCAEGYLEITIFNKINESWYFRRCNCCAKRTKSQRYESSVRGIMLKQS